MAAIALLAAIGSWLWTRGSVTSGNDAISLDTVESRQPGQAENPELSPAFRTKASIRELGASSATHRPEQLKDFILPVVLIDGLELEAALRKVLAAYQDACRKSGETPLALRFAVPPGTSRKLHLLLNATSFKTSVQLLATLSGMKVTRDGVEYRFAKIDNERRTTQRTLDVRPDFQSTLQELRGDLAAQAPLCDLVARLGLELDPSTRLTLGADGKLTLETKSSADAAAVSALVRTLGEQVQINQKFTTKVLELAADAKWTPPDLAQMDDAQLESLMRDMARRKGTELMTLPSITAHNGQSAALEITREFITPTDETETTFETHNIGKVMHIQGSALGFGHDLAFDYIDTTGSIDTATMKPVIQKRTELKDSGFSSDGGTRIIVQTRPDGSRAILLLTSTLIDATGLPLH